MLIFLDIDGVMVPAKSWKAPDLLSDGFPSFSIEATETLKKLISRGNTIVLTTSHKSNFSIEEWKLLFERRGILLDSLDRLPNNFANVNRKEEIVQWFNINNPSEEFIIIDDDKSLNDLPGFLKERLIQTSSYTGLTKNNLEEINTILSKRQFVVG